jgi:hypothetical protein
MATGQANSKSFWLCADLHRSTQANDRVLRPIIGSRFSPICPELTLRVVSFPVKPKKLPVNSRKGIEMGAPWLQAWALFTKAPPRIPNPASRSRRRRPAALLCESKPGIPSLTQPAIPSPPDWRPLLAVRNLPNSGPEQDSLLWAKSSLMVRFNSQ